MTSLGFIVHAYADRRKDRLYILGRLEDGRSFAIVESRWRPSILIFKKDLDQSTVLLSSINFEIRPTETQSFDKKDELLELIFHNYSGRSTAGKILEEKGIKSPDIDQKIQDAFLISHQIRGPVQIKGNAKTGRLVDLIFFDPELSVPKEITPLNFPLKLCSIDIETDIKTGCILALGLSVSVWNAIYDKKSLVRVLQPEIDLVNNNGDLIFHKDEKSLLQAFLSDIAHFDPDVLTGWNFLDFDYPRLAERCSLHRIPFALGRSLEEAMFFPSGSSGYSAAALVPGRQVIDALRVVRSGPQKLSGYTLETAAGELLGISKIVSSSGEKKIEDLEILYKNDPLMFGEYCKRYAELVLEIFQKTGLFRLSLERASLTGVSLDKAWTSVVSFERVYNLELASRKIAPPPKAGAEMVSGAAGGTVLDPLPGFFINTGVFDFRSLYPSIMRTFNIDPLSNACNIKTNIIQAPNGAVFSRDKGILPELIASYFEERSKALKAGDEEASHVYKILMNSFYGVLGTRSCRYGKTELAGAITSFARKWLLFTRDWFIAKGYRVLYGDTDSLFIESGLKDDVSYHDFFEWGKILSKELNLSLNETIDKEYGLKSFIELRFDKAYRRFMIPHLRNVQSGEGRGRAKGYAGWVMDASGKMKTEVKGMEAVRSDSTPLARRIQVELLEQVFKGGGENELKNYVQNILINLNQGLLDKELFYRKRLSRAPETYTASTPPQVKAARALGWKNRRGTVEYVWTLTGPQPTTLPHDKLDYNHYAETQILSVVRSIAAAAGWDIDLFSNNKKDHINDGQIELNFS